MSKTHMIGASSMLAGLFMLPVAVPEAVAEIKQRSAT